MDEVITVNSADMLEAINRSEIDVQIATARRFPRNIEQAKNRIVMLATQDKNIAYNCFYHLERTDRKQDEHGQWRDVKTVIEGLSIRMAEIIATSWGNLRCAARIIGNDGKVITAQGVCHDLETNVAISVENKRSIVNKQGKTYSQDMQVVTGNAAAAIAFRNAVLKVVPKVVLGDIMLTIQNKAREEITQRGVPDQWRDCVAAFQKMGVKEDELLAWLGEGRTRESIVADDIMKLGGVYTAINEGTTTVAECFKQPKEQKAQADAAVQAANAAKEKAAQAIKRNAAAAKK